MTSTRNPNVLVGIVVAQVLDSIAVAVLLPAVPFLAIRLGAPAVAVASLLSVQFACGAVGAPLWGWLSDRVPRAAVLLASVAAVAVCYWLLTIVDSIPLLFVLRALTGFLGSNLALLESMVAEMTSTTDRSTGLARLRLGSTVGLIVGPGAASLLGGGEPGDEVHRMIVLAAVAQTLVPVALGWTLRGRWTTPRPDAGPVRRHGGVVRRFLVSAPIRDHALIKALIATCFALVMAISPLWSDAHLGWTAGDLSHLVLGFGLALFVVQVAIATGGARWLTSGPALVVACLILVPGFGLLIAVPHGATLLVCCIALGTSSAIVNIVVPTTISRIAPRDIGAMLGLVATGVLAGSSLGPVAFGAIYERLGGAWTWCAGLLAALVASALALNHARPARDHT